MTSVDIQALAEQAIRDDDALVVLLDYAADESIPLSRRQYALCVALEITHAIFTDAYLHNTCKSPFLGPMVSKFGRRPLLSDVQYRAIRALRELDYQASRAMPEISSTRVASYEGRGST